MSSKYVENGLIDKNHFVSTGILGEGGFGRVVAAMFVKTGTWYAVKEINKYELVKHKCGVSMIMGELNAMKKIDHPFVINLRLAFHDRRYCFLVLDLKTGGDLRYYLKKRYLFDERDCAFYVACLSSALEHIHSKNIIHRDVKPENIILDERGYPYLTDFGVAHVQNDPWERYLTCNLASGTKQYLAPEVFTKSHIHGPEVDFWSLGVVIYEVLFGRRPFEKHAPIPFIQYLEKALSLKRRQLKEMKMRELTQTSELASPILSGFSGVRTSGDSTRQNSFSSISSPGRESRHRVLSTAKTSQLTEYSTWEKDSSTLYCSSAGYSQHSRESNKRVIQNQNGMNSGGSTLQDNAISSDNHQQLTDSSNSTPQKRIQLKVKDGFLPQLKQSHASISSSPVNTSASKTLFKRNPVSDEPIDIQAIAFVPNSSDNSLGSSSNDSSDLSEPTGRAQPGDHWLVDDGELPEALCVKVPYTNPWLGVLSNECVELLTGLFDVRPSHRYGCRNIDKIRCSPWLEAFKLSDWEELGKKQYRPRFQPGKRFIKDSLTGIDDISQGRLLGTPCNDGEVDESDNYEALEIISPEQEEMFKEFFHIGRIYEENEEPDTRSKYQKTERNDPSHRSNNQRQSSSILVNKKVQDVNAGKQPRERLYI